MSNINDKIEKNIGLIYYTINKFFPSRKGDDDIFQVGLIALWKAVEDNEKNKIEDAKFSSYAITRIKNAIIEEIRRENAQKRKLDENVVNVPLDDDETNNCEVIGRGGIPIISLLIDEYCDRQINKKRIQITQLIKQGYSVSEIVEITNLPKSTVYNEWKKIREDLKKLC